ncbi:putative toxic anion resistance protein [Gordonia effusa NBRC 100432]|uniref:Putative toxic anion resistance protein n=1 Tax=Gordonia effusa NBRC 100432 TaxID=1077974 RepID=H0QUI9_9ACTN|nr:toxic anion resistance protein [Gordonia effusa]GAB16490.1 putative toxic anion resistance protein [Gordonia effusa NBRC 100432]
MSELDLGGSTVPATPAQPAASGDLVLTPPAPVTLVKPEQAVGAVAVPPAAQTELQKKAAEFADSLVALDTRSPEFTSKVSSITAMGTNEMRASAGVANRILERPAATVRNAKGGGGGDAQTRVANTLYDLRNTVTDLDPGQAELSGKKKLLRFIPGGSAIDRYFAKYQASQTHLNAIIKALDSGQDELRKDNAAIETEKSNMWTLMGKLAEYNELAGALDEAVTAKVAQLEAAGRADDANTLKSDALFAIRQRRQDLMTQMTVNVQGYMALDLVRKNNLELIKGVDRAQTTTITALRTAVIVSQALARQKLVLDQINALNTTTSNLIEQTSNQLRIQGSEINQQAAGAMIDVEKLQIAFNNVFQAMDAVDTFRAQAVDSMSQTVTALEGQIEQAKPYLARIQQQTAQTPGPAGQIGS